jgi:uncharacterized protein (TIGR01777 family)
MPKRRVAITGASGLVGSNVVPLLKSQDWDVIQLTRKPGIPGTVFWDPTRGELDPDALEGIDAVIHLAGASIAGKRWSSARKQLILKSRTESTHLLATTLAGLSRPPEVLISTSAVGIYGDCGAEMLTESHPAGDDFLADVCVAWEDAANPAAQAGIRVVHPRFGVVMAAQGGLLPRISLPFKFGVGGRIGDGTQYQSWIDLDDLSTVLLFLLDQHDLAGPVNAVAPSPVTNIEFTSALASVLHRPSFLRVPEFAIRLMLGEMGEELILASQRAIPARLDEAGFVFSYPTIADSLAHQLNGHPSSVTTTTTNEPLIQPEAGALQWRSE